MAILPGSVSNTPTYGTRTNSTITAPSGIVNGNVLVAILHVGDGTALPALAVTPPAGWTEVPNSPTAQAKADPYTIATHVFVKVASGESGNYTFNHTSADTEGYMYRLTGADTTTPIDVTPVVNASNGITNGGTTNYPTITTVTNGAFMIYAESDWDAVGANSVTGTAVTITRRRAGTISLISDGTMTTAGALGAGSRTGVNGGDNASAWASIVVAIRPDTGGGTQTLTPSLFTDSDTFFAPTVAPGAVTLTPSLFTDADTFFAPTVLATYSLTSALFTDGDSFYAATVSPGVVTLTPGLYTDLDTFYAPTVTRGTITLTPGLYTDADTFYSATVAAGAITLTPSLFTDTDAFYAATVTAGTVTLTPSLYTDADTFYSPVVDISGQVTLTPSLFTDGDTFYSATVTVGSVTLTPGLYTDTDSFYSATISATYSIAPALYTDADTFYSATVTVGAVTLASSLFTDPDTFYSPTVSQVADQTLTASLFLDPDTFYGATVSDGNDKAALPGYRRRPLLRWPDKAKQVSLPEIIGQLSALETGSDSARFVGSVSTRGIMLASESGSDTAQAVGYGSWQTEDEEIELAIKLLLEMAA